MAVHRTVSLGREAAHGQGFYDARRDRITIKRRLAPGGADSATIRCGHGCRSEGVGSDGVRAGGASVLGSRRPNRPSITQEQADEQQKREVEAVVEPLGLG